MSSNLVVDYADAIATVTITRPRVMNAIDVNTLKELKKLIEQLAGDDSVRVVVLTGSGHKAFVAGADISELQLLNPDEAKEQSRFGQSVYLALEQMGKPVVASINGYALGAGCELAMACTLRIASENAYIGLPEITLGVLPGYGGTQRLCRLVGRGRGLEMMLTGRAIAAEEALRIGLVNQVVSADALWSTSRKVAEQLSKQAPVAMKLILTAVSEGLDMTMVDGCSRESELFAKAAETNDWREGIGAFLEKRPPIFSGS